eukprot:302459_1
MRTGPLLMVPQDASVGAIKKSFRKLALKYHPDKNTKDPKAPEMFANFTKIKDFLLDKQIKGEYDEKRKAKQAKAKLDAARSASMGERRRRFKDELDLRESSLSANVRAAEMERRQKVANLHAAQTESRKMREAVAMRNATRKAVFDSKEREAKSNKTKQDIEELEGRQIRVKWKRKVHIHGDDTLASIFSKLGEVEEVQLYGDKGNAAIVTFSVASSAKAAVEACNNSEDSSSMRVTLVAERKRARNAIPEVRKTKLQSETTVSHKDYESISMMKVRQAAERQRCNEQLFAEDSENNNIQASRQESSCETQDMSQHEEMVLPKIHEGDLLARMLSGGGGIFKTASASSA